MNRNNLLSAWTKLLAMILIVAAAGSGCQSKLFSYEGKTANQKNNISLQESGPHGGQWKTGDIIINYNYNNTLNDFQIEGTVELAPRLTKSFRDIGNLSVRANLLDEDRIVLKSMTILIAGNTPIRTWRFKEPLSPSPGARAMNFSYSGTAYEGGGGGSVGRGDRIDTSFWKEP
jgi:hypothetical protein